MADGIHQLQLIREDTGHYDPVVRPNGLSSTAWDAIVYTQLSVAILMTLGIIIGCVMNVLAQRRQSGEGTAFSAARFVIGTTRCAFEDPLI